MMRLSFMLFSLFFGAGNLLFTPYMGQHAGEKMPAALIGFLITTVVLSVMATIVIVKFNGMDNLSARVNKKFSFIYSILICLSIGPCLAIPRAASVPFEMAVAPYLPEAAPLGICRVIYSLFFFVVATWLALNPSKLMERISKYMTPTLLLLIGFVFVNFLFRGAVNVDVARAVYTEGAFFAGFVEGYQTLDMVAGLNYGLVIAINLKNLGVKKEKDIMHYSIRACIYAGLILAAVYLMLSYMGMCSSGIYPLQDNGAWILRAIVQQLFGNIGAIILAGIFTVACLSVCIGLLTSIGQFFEDLFKKFTYKQLVLGMAIFSFVICNQGLTTILNISVPILNAIYPMSIVLVIFGMVDEKLKRFPLIYPVTVLSVGVISVIHGAEGYGLTLGVISRLLHQLPLYDMGFGWIWVAAVAIVVAVVIGDRKKI